MTNDRGQSIELGDCGSATMISTVVEDGVHTPVQAWAHAMARRWKLVEVPRTDFLYGEYSPPDGWRVYSVTHVHSTGRLDVILYEEPG